MADQLDQPMADQLDQLLFDDGTITGTAFDHTGLHHTWPASRALAQFLRKQADEHVKGKRILEIGAGSGLPSQCCLDLGAERVIATDQDEQVVDKLRSLFSAHAQSTCSTRATRLDYDDLNMLSELLTEEQDIDVVLAADVVYPSKDATPLLDALEALLAEQTANTPRVILFALTKRDGSLHRAIESALAERLAVDLLEIDDSESDPLYGKAAVYLYRLTALARRQ